MHRSVAQRFTRSLTTQAHMARPLNWKSIAPVSPKGSLTFAHQDELPRLPLPSLSATLTKLKTSMKPLARNNREWEDASRKVDKLGEPGGYGETLHSRLEEWRNQPERENWLEEFWDDAAYLTYRDSVVVNVSYYYGFSPHPSHLPQTPSHRAAALTRAVLLFRQKLRLGLIPPDKSREGPYCMDSWRWMFDCSRVPGLHGKDWSVTFAKPSDKGDSGTVVFLRKGRVWKVDISKDGRLLGTEELERQIRYIYEHSDRDYPQVGVLSASNRDIWAKDYQLLAQSEQNRSVLEALHSCAFVLCLDSEKPEGPLEFSKAGWHGGVGGGELGNRWIDKPCQFIVWDNGKACLMGEHSVMDGTPTARMCDEVLDAIASPTFDNGAPLSSQTHLANPTPLDWEINPSITQAIYSAQKAAHKLVSSQSLTYLRTSYGKSTIKSFGFSPDSWTQMIIQLAYHHLQGGRSNRNGGTYEAATTRKFKHGRTECIRVVTAEALKWCESMDDEKVGEDAKRGLFREACKVHGRDAREAGNGMGVDRHMFGLRNLIRPGEPQPEIYTDPLYLRSSRWVLSTSAIFSKHFDVYGWGEVVPDGFGVAYMTGFDNHLQFTVTSLKEMPNEKFSKELDKAANDLRALFEGADKDKARL